MLLTCSGCFIRALRPTSYLNDDQALVKKVKLVGIDKQYIETVYQYVQRGVRPNSKVNLYLYNLLNTKHGKYRTDRIKKLGDAPNLLDSSLVEISRSEIEKYLATKGFLKAVVKSEMVVKHKKAYITFTADRGPVFRFNKFKWDIPDSALKRIYEENREKITKIHSGKRYDRDSAMFEIDTVYSLLKLRGYYDYLREYSHIDIDSNNFSGTTDLKFSIANPEGKDHHPVYTIDSTTFIITKSDGLKEGTPRTFSVDSHYLFKDYSGKFKPRFLSRYVFTKHGDLYNLNKVNLTSNRLYDLNVFRTVKVDFQKTSDSIQHLNSVISVVPLKRMSYRLEGEYTFNAGSHGFNVGNTYTNRNLFGGAEQLDIKVRYGILFDSGITGKQFSSVFNRDFQAGASLIFPRLLIPFKAPSTSMNGLPHTTFSSSLQVFDQRSAFTNRIFINSLTYDWVETRFKLHSLTPVNFEYRKGKLDTAFKHSIENLGYLLYIATNERSYLSLGSQYAFTYNLVKLNAYENFTYLKANADVAGNSIGLLGKVFHLNEKEGEEEVFGQRYLQYAKVELDLRNYHSFGNERQFIARINPGVGIPYGNTETLPFEKNFYAGGSSGVRAWQARTLGPGQYNRASIKDEKARNNFRNLDQLGELKLEGNLEYRFLLVQNFFGTKIKGAAFTDYGNIWRLRDTDNLANPGGVFKLNRFARQIAIGAGAGLRFDLQYFVIRFDVATKVRDPQFIDPQYNISPWVIGNLFSRAKFHDQYAVFNTTDKYHFLQYNFGIGMPF